jgi:tetratricopeptide (TPR) repeat protein
MRLSTLLFAIILCAVPAAGAFADTAADIGAYTLYKAANTSYKAKNYDEARNSYETVIKQYPDCKFVPYALYMLSFIDKDYVKLIYYLDAIQDRYPNFRYWTNAVERLGDIYYIMQNHPQAIEQYKKINTDNALYMLGVLNAANGFQDEAVKNIDDLLRQTKDNQIAFRGFMVQARAYFDMQKLPEVYNTLQQAVRLRKWADDNGARLLFYASRYYFQRQDVENHYQKSLYGFSLLKTLFPQSIESTMANQYLRFLSSNNILTIEPVSWIEEAYTSPQELAYQDQTITLTDELEQKAEAVAIEAESVAGNVVRKDVVEYVIRVGEYKDLGVANLLVSDVARAKLDIPLGVYYRNDMYYPEVRGIRDLDTAKKYAQQLLAMGYNDTRVIEVLKVTEYNR